MNLLFFAKPVMFLYYYIIFALIPLFVYTESSSDTLQYTEQLAIANNLFKKGLYKQAYNLYSKVLSLNSDSKLYSDKSYLVHYKQGVCSVLLNKPTQALNHFTKCVESNSKFSTCLIEKIKMQLMIGKSVEAKSDLEILKGLNPQKNKLDKLEKEVNNAVVYSSELSHLLEKNSKSKDDLEQINVLLTELINIAKHHHDYRYLRAFNYIKLNRLDQALLDLKKIQLLDNVDDNITILVSLMELLLNNDSKQALEGIKTKLKRDIENKNLKEYMRNVKFVQKKINELDKIIKNKGWNKVSNILDGDSSKNSEEKEEGLVKIIDKLKDNLKIRLNYTNENINLEYKIDSVINRAKCLSLSRLNKNNKDTQILEQVLEVCQLAIDHAKQNEHLDSKLFVAKAEVNQKLENYEQAINDYQEALNIDKNNKLIKEKIKQAKVLLKQSKQKDYYKILGIDRNVSKKELKKAYRKKALEWHPDRYRGKLSKQEVQNKMSDINQAYEVLNNEELRKRYDSGDDPYNPEQQAYNEQHQHYYTGGQHHGFESFFRHFGGGGKQQQNKFEEFGFEF